MSQEIVLKVFMHCEKCKIKVSKCLRSFDDVQEVWIDRATQRVIVRGNKLDPTKVLRRLRKKYSKNVDLISLKPSNEIKKSNAHEKDSNQVKLKIVVLKINMHCVACADEIEKQLQRMTGVMTVEANMENSRVIVKGNFEPPKLVEYLNKRLGKHAEILNQQTLLCEEYYYCNYNNPQSLCSNNNYVENPRPSLCICPDDDMFSDENPLSCSIL